MEEEEEGTAPVMEGTPCMVSDEKTTSTVLNTWCAGGYGKVARAQYVHIYNVQSVCMYIHIYMYSCMTSEQDEAWCYWLQNCNDVYVDVDYYYLSPSLPSIPSIPLVPHSSMKAYEIKCNKWPHNDIFSCIL